MVTGDVEFAFASRNGRSFKKKLKSKLEIIMEKRMLDHGYLSTQVCSVINAKIY